MYNTRDCVCVAEGGELCLTSGDRREPEDSDVYIKPLPPRSAKPSEGEEEGWGGGCYSSGSLRSPEVKHNSPPSATLHKLSILWILSYDAQRLYALWIPKA